MRKLKVMALYAHPADPITDCGGTLALHAENGDECSALVLTHGGRKHPNYFAREWRKENPDPKIINMTMQDIIDFKKAELMRAAEIIGIEKVICLDMDDDLLMLNDETIDKVCEGILQVRPDIILMDYPYPNTDDVHSLTSKIAFKALERVGGYLQGLDTDKNIAPYGGPKAVFFTKVHTTFGGPMTHNGARNDVFIDITRTAEKKVRAMDQFISQGYENNFARKFVEARNGAEGRVARVPFAEGYCRNGNMVSALLPINDYALGADGLMAHENYSVMDIRRECPYDPDWYAKWKAEQE